MKIAYFVIGYGVVSVALGLTIWRYDLALLLSGSSLILIGWSRRNTVHSPYRRHPSLLDEPRD